MSLKVGVKFIDQDGKEYHTNKDWGLILMSVSNPNPKPKYNFIEVKGSSNVIDLSEVFGEVAYEQRELTFRFLTFDRYEGRYERNGQIANALHGQKLKIILDDDKGFFYEGRVNFNSWEVLKKAHILQFTCTCDPYKYDLEMSSEPWVWDFFSFVDGHITDATNWYINGSATKKINGTNRIIYPEVYCSAPMQISIDGGKAISFPQGTTKAYDLPIPRGEKEHTLRVTGTGTLSINYRGVSF